MSFQRELRVLLMISFATASAVFTQSCASSAKRAEDFGPSSPYPFSFTDYDISEESCADVVLTVDLHIPDVYSHKYEFPIRARLAVDTGSGTLIPGGCFGGISGDNPFDGSGFNGSVNVFELTATRVTVSSDFSWTNSKHETGGFKKDFKLPYGKPLSTHLADGTTIEISWRKPKSVRGENPPEDSDSGDSDEASHRVSGRQRSQGRGTWSCSRSSCAAGSRENCRTSRPAKGLAPSRLASLSLK
jgi:hypothetical protein